MTATPRPPCLFSDWNAVHADGVPLSDCAVHRGTAFEVLDGRKVLLEDSGEVVEAVIFRHQDGRWWGRADWATQRDANGDEAWPRTHPAVW